MTASTASCTIDGWMPPGPEAQARSMTTDSSRSVEPSMPAPGESKSTAVFDRSSCMAPVSVLVARSANRMAIPAPDVSARNCQPLQGLFGSTGPWRKRSTHAVWVCAGRGDDWVKIWLMVGPERGRWRCAIPSHARKRPRSTTFRRPPPKWSGRRTEPRRRETRIRYPGIANSCSPAPGSLSADRGQAPVGAPAPTIPRWP